MARRRAQWAARQRLVDPARLVFIDETWTKTNMAPLRGWSRAASPASQSARHWIAYVGLAIILMRHDRRGACATRRAVNGETFRLYVDKGLVATLRQATSSSCTISARTRARPCGAPSGGRRAPAFPAQYSPDLNPIERSSRSSALAPTGAGRTADAVFIALGPILQPSPHWNAQITSLTLVDLAEGAAAEGVHRVGDRDGAHRVPEPVGLAYRRPLLIILDGKASRRSRTRGRPPTIFRHNVARRGRRRP